MLDVEIRKGIVSILGQMLKDEGKLEGWRSF